MIARSPLPRSKVFWRPREICPRAADSASLSRALGRAAARGQTACVELLLPLSDPKAHDSFALRSADMNGHADCLRLVLPESDPLARGAMALFNACFCDHHACVALLLSSPVDYASACDLRALERQLRQDELFESAQMIGPYREAQALLESALPANPAGKPRLYAARALWRSF